MAYGGLLSDRLRRAYLGQAKELTPGSAGTLTHVFDAYQDFVCSGINPDMFSDLELANNSEFTKVQFPGRKRVSVALPLPLSPEAWGFAMGYGLGDDTVSGTGADRTHTFTLAAMHALMPTLTGLFNQGGPTYDSDTDWFLHGLYVDGFDFTFGAQGWARLDIALKGMGALSAGSSQDESLLTTVTCKVPSPKVRMNIGPTTAEGTTIFGGAYTQPSAAGVFANNAALGTIGSNGLFDFSPYIDTCKVSVKNNPMGEDAAGTSASAGSIGAQPFTGNREVTVEVKYKLGTDTKVFERAIANSTQADNAEYSSTIEWVSDTGTGGAKIFGGMLAFPLLGQESTPARDSGLSNAMRTIRLFAKIARSGTDYGAIRAYLCSSATAVYAQ